MLYLGKQCRTVDKIVTILQQSPKLGVFVSDMLRLCAGVRTGAVRRGLADRELEAFAAFGSDLDAVSQAQLDRGYRLVELLKQGLNSPLLVEEQVVSIMAGTRGHLDDVSVVDVQRFEAELLDWFRTREIAQLDAIRETGKIGDEEAFEAAITAFAEQFQSSEADTSVHPGTDAEATGSHIVDADTTLPEEDITAGDAEADSE